MSYRSFVKRFERFKGLEIFPLHPPESLEGSADANGGFENLSPRAFVHRSWPIDAAQASRLQQTSPLGVISQNRFVKPKAGARRIMQTSPCPSFVRRGEWDPLPLRSKMRLRRKGQEECKLRRDYLSYSYARPYTLDPKPCFLRCPFVSIFSQTNPLRLLPASSCSGSGSLCRSPHRTGPSRPVRESPPRALVLSLPRSRGHFSNQPRTE